MNLHISPQRATDELLARPNLRLRVGDHVVDVGALRVLTRADLPRLTSKAVAVLIELVRCAGNTVTREQLFERVWTGRFTTDDVLTQAIKELRRAFGDDRKPSLYIETIPKVGYRLVARVLVLEAQDGNLFMETPASTSVNDDPGRAAAPPVASVAAGRSVGRSRLVLACAVALVVALIAYRTFAPPRVPGAAVESMAAPNVAASAWRIDDVHMLTSDPGAERRPHLSPDGTRVAFGVLDPDSGFDRIVVRSIEPSTPLHLTPGINEHEAAPVWSPDGTRIAYVRLHGEGCVVYSALSLGGGEREVGRCPDFRVNYFDWTPDGAGLITAQRSDAGQGALALSRLDIETGASRPLTYPRAVDDQDLEARYSPDGRRIAFRRGIAPYSDLFVMDAAGGGVRQVTRVSARIRGWCWTRDGSGLVFASDLDGPIGLHVVDIESTRVQALGIAPAEYPDAARAGDAVVYEVPRTLSALAMVTLDPAAPPPRVLSASTGNDFSPVLSPSGDRVLFASDRSGHHQLYVFEQASGTTTPLTTRSDADFAAPRWSVDGLHVVAVRRQDGRRSLVEIDLASLRQRPISAPGEEVLLGGPSIDADVYLMVVGTSGRDNTLVEVSHPGTAAETRRTLATSVSQFEVDAAARALYLTRTSEPGLFQLDPASGERRLLTAKVTSVSNDWHVVDGRIWYIANIEVKSANLRELDPATGADRVVSPIAAIMRDLSFSVAADRRSIIAVPLGTENTDVGMLRLNRAAPEPAAAP